MKIPNEGDTITVTFGDDTDHLYVVEVDDSKTGVTTDGRYSFSDDRIIVTCHDRHGEEFELRFYADDEDRPMPNRIIKSYEDDSVTLTLEETFSNSPFPDNTFYYVLRSVHSDGSVGHIGYFDHETANTDFELLFCDYTNGGTFK